MTAMTQAGGMPSDPRLKSLLDYWDEKRGTRAMPSRADIDPTTIGKDLLPWIALTEVIDGGARFRFRLCGTGLASIAGLDLTGRFIDELNPNLEYAAYIMDLYRLAVARRRPVYSETSYVASSVKPRSTVRLICPLSNDGATVNMCIAGQVSAEIGAGIHSSLTYADAFQPGRVEVL
jgi:hypothetical protein